jgi:small subunit ribosomal protein S16
MATVIRFARHGSKKRPYFRIVVQNHTAPRDGKFIEHIGAFDPVKGDASFTIERDRLEYWLGTGAQLSDSVRNRLRLKQKEWSGATPTTPSPAKKPKAAKEAPKEAKEA